MEEIDIIIKQAKQQEGLNRLLHNPHFPVFKALFDETIVLLKDITTLNKDYKIEDVKARQLSIAFLEGLINSLVGSDELLPMLTDQISRSKKKDSNS